MPSGTLSGTAISPGWGTAIGAAVGGLASMFGSNKAEDELNEAARNAAKAKSSGAKAATGTMDEYFKQAMALNAPGVGAYDASLGVLTPMLTGGTVPTPETLKWQGYIKEQEKALATFSAQLQEYSRVNAATDRRKQKVSPEWEAQMAAAIKGAQDRIAAATKNIQNARANIAGIAKIPGRGTLSVDEWLQSVDPGYQFRFDQGEQALANRQASRKDRFSGRAGKELVRYGQGVATDEYGKSVDRLFRLQGAGDVAVGRSTGATSNQGTGLATIRMADADQYAQSLLGQGQNAADNEANKSQAINTAIENFMYDRYRREAEKSYRRSSGSPWGRGSQGNNDYDGWGPY